MPGTAEMNAARQAIEITKLSKVSGPLTKRITLRPDGSLNSDGSACIMSEGIASRSRFDDLVAFAQCIEGLESHEAVALGALRDDLPDVVQIRTKKRLEALKGPAPPGLISRTGGHISYRPGQLEHFQAWWNRNGSSETGVICDSWVSGWV
jgi:hypothetical protein